MLEHHVDLIDDTVALSAEPGRYDDPQDEAEVQRVLTTLRELRTVGGLTQRQIADRMGLRQPTIAGYGARGTSPRVRTLQRYARACGARLTLGLQLIEDPLDPQTEQA
jgi:transcriptional regulator with XRE-family HTH domain